MIVAFALHPSRFQERILTSFSGFSFPERLAWPRQGEELADYDA